MCGRVRCAALHLRCAFAPQQRWEQQPRGPFGARDFRSCCGAALFARVRLSDSLARQVPPPQPSPSVCSLSAPKLMAERKENLYRGRGAPRKSKLSP